MVEFVELGGTEDNALYGLGDCTWKCVCTLFFGVAGRTNSPLFWHYWSMRSTYAALGRCRQNVLATIVTFVPEGVVLGF